jgi:hypothetical protein
VLERKYTLTVQMLLLYNLVEVCRIFSGTEKNINQRALCSRQLLELQNNAGGLIEA